MTVEDQILYLPVGYRFDLLFASYLKFSLQQESDPRRQCDTLEMLEALTSQELRPEAIKAIEPMPEVGIKIMHTAFKLDRDSMRKGYSESYKVLTREDVFGKLLEINPSLKTAITIYSGR